MDSAARARARTGTGARSTPAARSARQKLADRQAADRRARTRRRLLLAGGSVAVVLALVATLIAVKLTQSPPRGVPPAGAGTTAQVQGQVTSVPPATFNAVGAGPATGFNTVTGQPPLTSGGKPEILYIGGEYCPYCAAERWALAAAVSRFGTLSGLGLIHSSPTDVYADTPTLTFAKATYTSSYLSFVPVEWFGEAADPGTPFGHAYLQQPTAQQQALFARYGGGSIPFVDIGNRYLLPQVQYLPSALAGRTWTQVAAAMHDPSSPIAKDIDGAANIITAAICTLTNGQPAGVCQSAGVQAAAAHLGS
jgi:hypothetical protein